MRFARLSLGYARRCDVASLSQRHEVDLETRFSGSVYGAGGGGSRSTPKPLHCAIMSGRADFEIAFTQRFASAALFVRHAASAQACRIAGEKMRFFVHA